MMQIKGTTFTYCAARTAFIAVIALVASLIGLPTTTAGALAQDAASTDAGQEYIEVVYSTARKRVEPLQDTPVASTVLSGQALELRFFNDLKTMEFPAPNVNIARVSGFSNAVSLSIRGISNADIDSSIDPPVAIFVDGVYLARPVASSLDLFDVEAIEILRGPQGTLFGRNTTAGAIQVRTQRPTDEFGIKGRVTVGKFGRLDIRAAVNVPVVEDKFAARLAFQSQNMDGYYTSAITGGDLGGENIIAVRPTFQFTPSDSFDLTIIGEYHSNKSEMTPQSNASQSFQFLCLLFGECGTPFKSGDEYLVRLSPQHKIDAEIWGVTVEANWDVGPGTITSVSNYRETDEFIPTEVDSTDANMFFTTRDTPHKQYSSELRFASTEWDKINVVTGIYYFHQEYELTRNTWVFSDPAVGTPLVSITGQDHDSFSVFAEGDYDVTEKLTIIVGGRWSWERKDFFQQPFFPGTAGTLVDVDPVSWNNFGPKAGLEYHWNDDLMSYFTWSRGFKSGGFNGRCGQAITCNRNYDPETVDGFEVGVKGDFLDNRLRVNLAMFWNSYTDLQRTVIVPLPGAANPQETVTDNAATADIRGIELELTAVPLDGLQIDVGLGILDAEYGSFCADLNGAANSPTVPTSECGAVVVAGDNDGDGILEYLVDEDLSADSLSRAPKFNISIGLNYEFDVGNSGSVIVNGRWSHTSKQFLNTGNRSLRTATDLVDASIGFVDIDGRYRVTLFGRNLTKALYLNHETLVAALLDTRGVNAPRRWGVEIAFDL